MGESLIRKHGNMKKNRTLDSYAWDISYERICNKGISNIFTPTKSHDRDVDCHHLSRIVSGAGQGKQ